MMMAVDVEQGLQVQPEEARGLIGVHAALRLAVVSEQPARGASYPLHRLAIVLDRMLGAVLWASSGAGSRTGVWRLFVAFVPNGFRCHTPCSRST